MASNDLLCERQSKKSGYEPDAAWRTGRVISVSSATMRPDSGKGRGRRSTPCTTEKMAVFAPIPRPSVATATSVKAGERRRSRTA